MSDGVETADPDGPQFSYSAFAASRLLWRACASSGMANRSLAALRPLVARYDRLVAIIPSHRRIFEIGCGNGLLLFLLHACGSLREGVGIDINPGAIAAAQRTAVTHRLPVTYFRSTTLRDWPVGQFDVVLMVDVLHHVPRRLRRPMIEAAIDRVGPGGLFIYKDMCRRPVVRRLWNQLHDLLLAQQLVSVEPIEHVLGWAAAAGFNSMISERYVGAGLYGHELEVLRRRET